jgi:SAM-dependent methyltransferase
MATGAARAAEGLAMSELTELYGATKALLAAEQSGLIASLIEPASAAGHAERLGLDAAATGLLLDVLAALGLAARSGDVYGPTEGLRRAAGFGGQTGMTSLWDHLPTFLRDGSRFVRMDGDAGERGKVYVGVVGALATLFEQTAAALAERLEPRSRILDVGAGSGVWSLAMGARAPEATVTALDLPDVLPAFLARAGALSLSGRVETIGGDFHTTPLGERRYDRVVLANVLHLEPSAEAAALVERAAAALDDRGDLVVIDALAAGTRERDLSRTVYALHLGMRTDTGRNHPLEEISGWCRAAGLERVETVEPDVPPQGFGALVARTA